MNHQTLANCTSAGGGEFRFVASPALTHEPLLIGAHSVLADAWWLPW